MNERGEGGGRGGAEAEGIWGEEGRKEGRKRDLVWGQIQILIWRTARKRERERKPSASKHESK